MTRTITESFFLSLSQVIFQRTVGKWLLARAFEIGQIICILRSFEKLIVDLDGENYGNGFPVARDDFEVAWRRFHGDRRDFFVKLYEDFERARFDLVNPKRGDERMMRQILIILLCSTIWCGCVSTKLDSASEGPVLGSGDHLVFGTKSGCDLGDIALRIDETGMVSLPLSQTMQLGGLTLKEAETQINERYKPYIRNADFFLNLGAPNAEMKRYITLHGEFQRPGTYAWTNGMTAGAALELAGGMKPSSRIQGPYLIPSRGRPVETIQLTKNFRVKKDVVLWPGDLIYAPAE